MSEHLYNYWTLQLVGDIDDTETTVVVNYLPAAVTAADFRIQIDAEIMKVTGVTGTSLTVVRGQEGTTAAIHNGTDNPAVVGVVITAAGLGTFIEENAAVAENGVPAGGSTGEVLKKASNDDYDTEWSTDETGGGGGTFTGVRVTKSTTTSVPQTTLVAVAFDTEQFDTDAYHEGVTNPSRLTIPTGKGGKYLVGFVAQFQAFTGAPAYAMVTKNGTEICGSTIIAAGSNFWPEVGFASLVELAESDYVELKVMHDAASTYTLAATAGATPCLWLQKVG